MAAPDEDDVKAYLGDTGHDDDAVKAALAAEKAAQAAVCRVPADDADWPADLVEALCRRVLRNLAMRNSPLGLMATVNELGTSQIRLGSDPEVRRLEAPYVRLVVG